MISFHKIVQKIRTIKNYDWYTSEELKVIKDIQNSSIETLLLLNGTTYATKFNVSRQCIHERLHNIIRKQALQEGRVNVSGVRLQAARKAKHLSQETLAKKVNLTRQHINYAEKENIKRPLTFDSIALIAKELDVSIDFLLGTSEENCISISKELKNDILEQLNLITNVVDNLKRLLE